MTIKQRLAEEMKISLKAGDTAKLGAVRYALSEIKTREIDTGELDDQAAGKILSRLIKQSQESIEQYRKGQRLDLVKTEEFQISVWQSYLPKPLSQTELEAIVNEVVAQIDSKEFGQVMPAVMTKVAGKAPGALVAQLVKSALSQI